MKILVTGANGQLGNEMRLISAKSASNSSPSCMTDVLFTDVTDASDESVAMLRKLSSLDTCQTLRLDITDIESIRRVVKENDVKVIVNCAAFTNVDAAESNEALAEKLNADAPANLASVMKETGGLLVHISTDYVFGKEAYNTPCAEDRTGTPTGVYGLTKLHGEQKIIASGCNYVIIRTAWLYSEFGKNFCKTMLNLTASRPSLNVVFDQAGTPTYARDLASAIEVIVSDYSDWAGSSIGSYPRTGIYHFSNEGVCSWYDFTKSIQNIDNELRQMAGECPTTCVVRPCHSNEFPSPVARPSYSVLDKTKIKSVFAVDVPYWTDSLKECIMNIKKSGTF